MEQAFGRIVAVFTAVIMLFIAPLVINLQRQENLIHLAVMQHTVEFVDSVRNMGVLTEDMLFRYESQIRQLKGGLEIFMTHTQENIQEKNGQVEVVQVLNTECEIREALDTSGSYELQMGDYFRVEVKKPQSGFDGFLYGWSWEDNEKSKAVYAYYGGSIRYEDK